jgi:hypothetical protein
MRYLDIIISTTLFGKHLNAGGEAVTIHKNAKDLPKKTPHREMRGFSKGL